jgi:hypothetical protein
MPAKDHPCGAVPVSTWSVSIWYCHEHQQWWASHLAYVEAGRGDPRVHRDAEVQFGPFDDHEDVSIHLQRWLPTLASMPGAWGKLGHPAKLAL